ncbi:hypothetical protein E2320_014452 [Naja naja]|nr:hypothetical protein E2320_014452 [Naja naja]
MTHGKNLLCRAAFLLFPESKQQLEDRRRLGLHAVKLKCHVQSPSLFLPGCPQDFSPRILQPASPGHWSTQNIGRDCGSSYKEKARGKDK